MREHNKQDTAVISIIVVAAFILILLVFRKSVQAKLLDTCIPNHHVAISFFQDASESIEKADDLNDGYRIVNYRTLSFDENKIFKQFFSY